jgi:hypothetical protein
VPLRRTRPISRLEALSDGVFAFAATLLVVSLEVPRTFPQLVQGLREGAFVFGLSFGALILIWAAHNGFFRRYGLHDGWTTFLNAALLFVVLFYVYPLKYVSRAIGYWVFGLESGAYLVSTPAELSQLFILYGAGFVAIFVCLAFLYRHAAGRRDRLRLDAGDAHDARFYFRHYLIFAAVGLLSIAASAGGLGLRVGFPGWVYFLIGPLCWIHGVQSARRRPIVEPTAVPSD